MTTRAVYWTFRRELAVTLRAPIVYVVGGLFLIVQGLAFAGLVGALSDPKRPAPLGALLEGQLSGTLLTWVLQLVVITLLGMRTVADERRTGGWELLVTAGASERAAIVGKWLAASAVYALLWVPTLAYLAVVAAYRGEGGGWDLASIACGYAGAIALGAALLAWAIAASAATTSSLAAGALGFAALIGIFLVGELPSLWPELGGDHPSLSAVLAACSLRGQLASFARGEITVPAVALIAGLAATGLSLAIALACADRRARRESRARFAACALVAAIAVLAGVIAARHPARWDVTASGRNSLDPSTAAICDGLTEPATLTIVWPTLAGPEPVYEQASRVAARMAERGPIHVRRIDPAALGGGIAAAAREAGVPADSLEKYGGVVVELGGRRRVVDLPDLATIDSGATGAPTVEQVAIERALAGALAALATAEPYTACVTTGHGELPFDVHAAQDADWTAVADRLRGDGATLLAIDLTAEPIPSACDVVIVTGPSAPLSPEEALALQAFVARGKGLLVAAASRPIGTGALASTGLEGVLAADGLGLPPALVVDPSPEVALRGLPGAILVTTGYAEHPIDAGFAGGRATLWYQPRAVTTTGGALALVTASKQSYQVEGSKLRPRSPDDPPGPVALAALGGHPGHRVIALGSAESFATSIVGSGVSAGDLWLAQAVRWLAAKPVRIAIDTRTPDQLRLVMTDAERRAVIALSVAGIPLAWIVIGGGLVLWRRRRAARAA